MGVQPDAAGGVLTISFLIVPGEEAAKAPGAVLVETLVVVEMEMKARKQTIGLALDEFPRLTQWEPHLDWLLKGVFDAHRHVAYVSAGSQRSLIDSMIDSKKNGYLYKMVDVLFVSTVPLAAAL